jgi:hypothetical protein
MHSAFKKPPVLNSAGALFNLFIHFHPSILPPAIFCIGVEVLCKPVTLNLGEMCPIVMSKCQSVELSECRNFRASVFYRVEMSECCQLQCLKIKNHAPCHLVSHTANVPHRPCQCTVPNQHEQAHLGLETGWQKV